MPASLTPEVSRRELTRDEVAAAISSLLESSVSDEAKAEFLRAWAKRIESAAELAAAAETLLPLAVDPGIRGTWNGQPLLDCCGTGGGGLNILNISTGIVFILAAMGIPVVKHGNRGITKKSGSADVLEALGIKIDLKPDQVKACLDEVGAAFLYAPLYHTTFAAIAPVRQKLAAEGQRTIFNLLGPLLNPARPDARLVGVFRPEHVDMYCEALQEMHCQRFTVACGKDTVSGARIGEISAKGSSYIGGRTRRGKWVSEIFEDFQSPSPGFLKELMVENAEDSAKRLYAILSSAADPFARDTLLVNATVAAWTQGKFDVREGAYAEAKDALDSGRALKVLKKWQAFSAKL